MHGRRHGLAPQPPPAAGSGRFERNDLFPLCFSALGVGVFAAAATSAVGVDR